MGRRLLLAASLALLVVAAVLQVAIWADDGTADPVPIGLPPEGITAAQLVDGHPVFLGRGPDGSGGDAGSVWAVDAASPVEVGGVRGVVVWCPRAQAFEDPFTGARFDARGRYLDGPAPTGLTPLRAELAPDDDHVLVGPRGEPFERLDTPPARAPGVAPDATCVQPTPDGLTLSPDAVTHPTPPDGPVVDDLHYLESGSLAFGS